MATVLRIIIITCLCAALAMGVYALAMGRPGGLIEAVVGVIVLTFASKGLFSEQAKRERAERAQRARSKAARQAVKTARPAGNKAKSPVLKQPKKPAVRKRHTSRHAATASRRAAARA